MNNSSDTIYDSIIEIIGSIDFMPVDTPYGVLLASVQYGEYWFIYVNYPYKWNVKPLVWGLKCEGQWYNYEHSVTTTKTSLDNAYDMMLFAVNFINTTWIRMMIPASSNIHSLEHSAKKIISEYHSTKNEP